MSKDNQLKLVEALRSGKYKQGRGRLRDAGCFCFWGVACDISGVGQWEGDGALCFTTKGSDFKAYALPSPLVESWLGFNVEATVKIDGISDSLMGHNDTGSTFEQLADAIEQQIINKTE